MRRQMQEIRRPRLTSCVVEHPKAHMEVDTGPNPRQVAEQAFSDTGPRLWRAIAAYAGDREIASDAVAEAFAQVLARGAGVVDVRAWVWAAAFRIAAGALATRSVLTEPPERSSPELSVETVHLLSALRELSPAQRGAIVLYYYGDLPTAHIGRILGMSAGAVRVHLFRGRRRLRELLERGEQ